MRAAVRHHATVVGGGAETIVLGHGFGSDRRVWKYIVPTLARRYRVMTYDLACAGSVCTDVFDLRRHATLDGYVEDLQLVLNDLAVERCTYVGHSVSAMIGVIANQRMPGRFERMFLIAASPRYLNDTNYHGGFEPEDLHAIYDSIAAEYREWATSFAPFVSCQDPESAVTRDFTESLLAIRPDIALWAAKAIFESDIRNGLAACSTPTVLFHVRKDPAVPIDVAHYLNRHLRGSVLEMLDTSGHLPHLSAPEQVLEAILRHLSRSAADYTWLGTSG